MDSAAPLIQTKIAKIWESILRVQIADPHSDFFQLGGDSVSMIDMLMTLGEELQTEINPGLLFEDSTLSGFAKAVDRQIRSENRDVVGTI